MKILFKILLFLGLSALIYSCNKNDVELTFGEKYVNTLSSLTLIDTFSVELSTVKFDSIVTSNTNTILVGHLNDEYVGGITSTSFFELGTPGSSEIDDRTIYDSVVLVLNYTSYFGDTSQPFKISVHQLGESIESADGEVNLYNTSSVNYNFHALGSKIFYPKPLGEDSFLEIRLSDEIGNYLFEGLKNNDADIVQVEKFLDAFKGLAIVGNHHDNQAILGFLAENVMLKIYTHDYNSSENNQTFDFPINMIDNQFNRIESLKSGTILSSLETLSDEVASSYIDGLSFIYGGIGLATKVKFPTIDALLLYEDIVIKAELVFFPKKNSYSNDTLPSDLVIYQIGKHNAIETQLYADEETPIYPFLLEDDLFQENTYYSFNVTGFLKSGIENMYFDPNDGLLISLNSTDIQNNFSRVLIDTEFTPELRLYLLKY